MMTYNQIKGSAEYILTKTRLRPKMAIVLGSGLSPLVADIEDAVRIPYKSIPRFVTSNVHEGVLYIGRLEGVPVAVMSGRMHCYEGYSMAECAYPVAVLKAAGVEKIVLTNAAGGISPEYRVGEFVLIRDHIKLVLDSPLRGEDAKDLGGEGRFFDMTDTYSRALREKIKGAAALSGMELHEGVYAYMGGPQFETPAEITALASMGADLVGMSTVPEAIMASAVGLPAVGVSVVTNMAAGVTGAAVTNTEVNETGAAVAENFKKFLRLVVRTLGED
mgnify:CR=1 FL=1